MFTDFIVLIYFFQSQSYFLFYYDTGHAVPVPAYLHNEQKNNIERPWSATTGGATLKTQFPMNPTNFA